MKKIDKESKKWVFFTLFVNQKKIILIIRHFDALKNKL